jgi:hypothetical protein
MQKKEHIHELLMIPAKRPVDKYVGTKLIITVTGIAPNPPNKIHTNVSRHHRLQIKKTC